MKYNQAIMKYLALLIAPQLVSSVGWTWMKGSQYSAPPSNVGTPGVPSPMNNPSCIFESSYTYSRELKTLYAYGSYCYGTIDSFWSFNMTSGYWTYLAGSQGANIATNFGTKGIAASANSPRSLSDSYSGVDADLGLFYLFGGMATLDKSSQLHNFLWNFNMTTGWWTWMGGSKIGSAAGVSVIDGQYAPTNWPGCRYGGVYFFDKNTSTLNIGYGYGFFVATGKWLLNDIWQYNTTSSLWRVASGKPNTAYYGRYGALGDYSTLNFPGGRYMPGHNYDTINRRFYVYGGNGYTTSGNNGNVGDLWCYDVETSAWAWVGGSQITNDVAVFGPLNKFAPENLPKGRYYPVIVYNPMRESVYMFGGLFSSGGTDKAYNDFWEYSMNLTQWRWLGGRQTIGSPGRYGILGTESPSNAPGARSGNPAFFDYDTQQFYNIGGLGSDIVGAFGYLNDVWKFQAPINRDNDVEAFTTTIAYENTTTTTSEPETPVTSTFMKGQARGSSANAEAVPFFSTKNPGFIIGIIVAGVIAVIGIAVIVLRRSKQSEFYLPSTAAGIDPSLLMMSSYGTGATFMAAPSAGYLAPGAAGATAMGVAAPFMQPFQASSNPIPEHLRCDKGAFDFTTETRQEYMYGLVRSAALNPTLKDYGETLLVKDFGGPVPVISDRSRAAFFQDISILWMLRNERSAAKFLAFCVEPATIVTMDYPIGFLSAYMTNPEKKFTTKDVLNLTTDASRILNLVHRAGFGLRTIFPGSLLLDKIKSQNNRLSVVFYDFSSVIPLFNEMAVQQMYLNVNFDNDQWAFAAPELIAAKNGQQVPGIAPSQLVRAGDVYTFGLFLYCLLMRKDTLEF